MQLCLNELRENNKEQLGVFCLETCRLLLFSLSFCYSSIRWTSFFLRVVSNKRGHRNGSITSLAVIFVCYLGYLAGGEREVVTEYSSRGWHRGKPGGSIRVILQLPAYGESTDERKKAYMAGEKKEGKTNQSLLDKLPSSSSPNLSPSDVFSNPWGPQIWYPATVAK